MSARDDAAGAGMSAQQPEAKPVHKPFSWLHTDKGSRSSSFIESVADMCSGVQTCLQLVHSNDMALHARTWGEDEVPILGPVDHERLLRLAIAVTGALAAGAHQEIEWINEQGRKKAQQGGDQ
jgi:hypothetical protein